MTVEDLEGQEVRALRFPAAAVRRRASRERMLVRRRRSAVAALVVIVALATVVGGGTSVASRKGAPPAVTVAPGETLWEVASRYAPEGTDLRAYVDALVELNRLRAAPAAGQRLRLPR